ncbi:MAG: mechanosensitive ion channel domain-containing protein [Eudoraea sp.]|uniref:mechanosensitive ion channel family protein n=2 Tax=Eudoraea sp. TaxID=1979955 RepID=UPI003C7413AE
MYSRKKKPIINFLFLLLFLGSLAGYSQVSTVKPDSTLAKAIEAIPIIKIIPNIEETYAGIKLIEKKIEPKKGMILIDSLFPKQAALLQEKEQLAEEFIKANPNRQKVDNLIYKWSGYRDYFKGWSETINENLGRNIILYETIVRNQKKWELTYENAITKEVPVQLISSIEDVLDDLDSLHKTITQQNNNYLSLESSINDQITIIDLVTKELIALKNSEVYDLFNLRHPPIWKASFATTKTTAVKAGVESLGENLSNIWELIITGENQIYIYILFIILITIGFLYLKKSFIKYGYKEDNKDLLNARAMVVEQPIWSIIYLSLFVAFLFFKNTPILFDDIIILFVLVCAIPIVQPFIYQKFRNVPYFIVLVFILDTLKTYLWFSSPQYRIYLLIEALTVAGILLHFTYPYIKTRKLPLNKFGYLLVTLTPVIYFLILVSILSNILGYSNLADISLILGTQSSVLTLIFYALLMVADGIGIGFINDHFNNKASFDKTKKITLELKTLQVIRVLAFGFWFFYFLKMVDLFQPLSDMVTDTITEPFQVGSITFTFGAILSFIGILATAFLITSFVSFLLDGNEVKFNFIKLPKGIPAAVSLVIRYFILAFGFVLALSVLGIDLSKFNLMAGALGLGIGFGLQTIVSNFISGIILVFERPILPGDRVEVNNLMGTVNKIGVRSSQITTFDGAEVVVPNNNLISNDLINWTHTDNIKRIEIMVGTSYDSDPNTVLKVLTEIANENGQVLKTPPPKAYFNEFGESALIFRLLFWVYFDNGLSCKSDISVAIYDRFSELGIEIPFPQRVLHIPQTSQKNSFEIVSTPNPAPVVTNQDPAKDRNTKADTDEPPKEDEDSPSKEGRDKSSNW